MQVNEGMVLRKSGSILRLVPSCAFAVVIAAGTAAALYTHDFDALLAPIWLAPVVPKGWFLKSAPPVLSHLPS